jgi:hypothetical protein
MNEAVFKNYENNDISRSSSRVSNFHNCHEIMRGLNWLMYVVEWCLSPPEAALSHRPVLLTVKTGQQRTPNFDFVFTRKNDHS